MKTGCLKALFLTFVLSVGGGRVAEAQTTTLNGFNAWAYGFNIAFAQTVVRPFLDGVRSLPDPVPAVLENAFANLTEPVSALSHLMVGDPWAATRSTARFAINSTVGLLGAIDVASPMGLPSRKRHFSEGVCAMGLPLADRYMVVPAIGSSSVGIAGAAVIVMAGSTWALSYISLELAIASTLADVSGSAAALESMAASPEGDGDARADEASFSRYLSRIGC